MLDRRPAHSSLTPTRRITRRLGLRAHSAGVAQPAEHLFCKQAVGGSTPPVSSTSFDTTSEGCPSGQREQAVNLPDFSYVGSNPTPSTSSGVLAVPNVVRPSRVGSRARRPRRFVMGRAVSVASIDLFFQDVGSRRGGAVAPRSMYLRRALTVGGRFARLALTSSVLGSRRALTVGEHFARLAVRSQVLGSSRALTSGQPLQVDGGGTPPAARQRRRDDLVDLGRTDRSKIERRQAPQGTGETGAACSSSATDAGAAGLPERQNKELARVHGRPKRQHKTPAGVAQLVEHQPSKLNVVGSSPISRSADLAHIAQLAERVLGKDEVTSSNLVVGSASFVGGTAPAPPKQVGRGPAPGFGAPAAKRIFSVSANPPHQEGSLE
jgi:hypothetical protein